MGVLKELAAVYAPASPLLAAFLMPGVLGGFTTFSSFALEYGQLGEKGLWGWGMFYVFASVTLSLFAFFLGVKSVRLWGVS